MDDMTVEQARAVLARDMTRRGQQITEMTKRVREMLRELEPWQRREVAKSLMYYSDDLMWPERKPVPVVSTTMTVT